MAELTELLKILVDQHKTQQEQNQEQIRVQKEQIEIQKTQIKLQQQQFEETLKAQNKQIEMLQDQHKVELENKAASTSFQAFDPTSGTWANYWNKFMTFIEANSVSEAKQAKIFLTNQSDSTFKILSNLAEQEAPSRDVNQLSMEDIKKYMSLVFDPKRILIRERYRYWLAMKRKPGETIQELAARTRRDASTCEFKNIRDPLDEALRLRFICSVDNEAVLKALFQLNDEELTFLRAVEIAQSIEESAKVAKDIVYEKGEAYKLDDTDSINKVKSKPGSSKGKQPYQQTNQP